MDTRLQDLYNWAKEEKREAGLVKNSQGPDHEYYLGKWCAYDEVCQRLYLLLQADSEPNED